MFKHSRRWISRDDNLDCLHLVWHCHNFLLLNVHVLEVEIGLVLGQLDLLGGVGDDLIDTQEEDEEDVLDDDEEAGPLEVSPVLAGRVPEVQGQQGQVGQDGQQGRQAEGMVPGAGAVGQDRNGVDSRG